MAHMFCFVSDHVRITVQSVAKSGLVFFTHTGTLDVLQTFHVGVQQGVFQRKDPLTLRRSVSRISLYLVYKFGV